MPLGLKWAAVKINIPRTRKLEATKTEKDDYKIGARAVRGVQNLGGRNINYNEYDLFPSKAIWTQRSQDRKGSNHLLVSSL